MNCLLFGAPLNRFFYSAHCAQKMRYQTSLPFSCFLGQELPVFAFHCLRGSSHGSSHCFGACSGGGGFFDFWTDFLDCKDCRGLLRLRQEELLWEARGKWITWKQRKNNYFILHACHWTRISGCFNSLHLIVELPCPSLQESGFQLLHGMYYKSLGPSPYGRDAEAMCEQEGGHLPSLRTAEDVEDIHALRRLLLMLWLFAETTFRTN